MSQNSYRTELSELIAHHEAKTPELEVTLKDDNLGLEGHIVVWDTELAKDGPLGRCGKGGTRIVPDLSLDTVRMLARKMALKNAAAGLPLGGAKSGVRSDSRAPDIKEKYQRFAELARPHLHENGGIFGGFGFDIGAHKDHPHWVVEALGSGKSFTGKPLELGGTDYDREGVAGLGVAVAAREGLAHSGRKDITQASYAVQGAGAMGAAVIRYFEAMGAHLQALSDPRLGGTWRLKDKAPIELIQAISNHDFDSVQNWLKNIDAKLIEDSNAVLYEGVDVLFPCAVQDIIHDGNADDVEAYLVVEGANSPCTFNSYAKLHNRNVDVIPDFLANTGGIIAAFIEMTHPASIEENLKTGIKVQAAKTLTEEKISENVRAFLNLKDDTDLQHHEAAYYLALSRLYTGL